MVLATAFPIYATDVKEEKEVSFREICQRRCFHAACCRTRRTADEHQKDHHARRRTGHRGQTYKDIEVNTAYRWFLGLSLDDKVPHFTTYGKNYS